MLMVPVADSFGLNKNKSFLKKTLTLFFKSDRTEKLAESGTAPQGGSIR